MSELLLDLREAARGLRRRPGFTLGAVLTLALGIGAVTTVFSVVKSVVLDPLPYDRDQRVAAFWEPGSWSFAEFDLIRERQQAFSAVAAFTAGQQLALGGRGRTRIVDAVESTAELNRVLDVAPVLGTDFAPDVERTGAEPVVLVSHAFWHAALGGDSAVVGTRLELDGVSHTVIGVMPRDFVFPDPSIDVWRPLRVEAGSQAYYGNHSYQVLGRLADGVSWERGRDEASRLGQALAVQFEYPAQFDKSRGATVQPLRSQLVGEGDAMLWLLLSATGLILVIVCVNVANLQTNRALGRRHEVAVRAALGAGRWRLARQLFAESAVLAVAGGVTGTLLATLGVPALVTLLTATPRLHEVQLDGGVLAFAGLVSAIACIAFGMGPAITVSRSGAAAELATRTRSSGRSLRRWRSTLVVVETAVAVIVVVCAGLLGKSVWRLGQIEVGFRSDRLITMRLVPPSDRTPADRSQLYRQVLEHARALPEVRGAAAVQHLPLREGWLVGIDLDRGEEAGEDAPITHWRSVSPGYLELLGIPLLEGRPLGPQDRADGEPVAVVSSAFARRYWGGESALGRRVRVMGGDWLRVVGVVADTKVNRLRGPAQPVLYQTYGQRPLSRALYLVARHGGDPAGAVAGIRRIVDELAPRMAVADIETMDQVIAAPAADTRSLAAVAALLAGAALALGGLGLFAVLSYSVLQRTRDIGIRLALGATRHTVLRQVVLRGLTLTALGAGLGTIGAVLAARALATQLYNVGLADPAVLGATAAVLTGVALTASWLPARRATRIEPMEALRHE